MRRGEDLKELYRQQKEQASVKNCPNCRVRTTELYACAGCGKLGCEACMTFDPVERKYYCEQCWN